MPHTQWLCLLLLWTPVRLLAQPVTEIFSLEWQQPIGLTTYRTQLQFDPGQGLLFVGSNGESRTAKDDPQDGLHVLKAKNGKRKYQLLQGTGVDDDVNGVAIDGRKVFFGNDHGQFFCYQKKKQLWSYQVPGGAEADFGDVEGQPALADLNGDGVRDVVFAAEEYGLIALDGEDGSLLWQYAQADGNGHGLGSPITLDVNDDGVADLLWGTRTPDIHEGPDFPWGSYGDYLLALDGRSGAELWRVPTHSALHASPRSYYADPQGEAVPYAIFAETYSRIHILDPYTAKPIMEIEQELPTGGISAFFSTPTLLADRYLLIGTSWWGDEDGVWVMDLDQAEVGEGGQLSLPEAANTFYQAGRVSATAVTGDLFPAQGEEAVIGTESGELLVFSSQGELLHRLELPAGLEAPALIADVDGDGRLELLLACLDGQLYCYQVR